MTNPSKRKGDAAELEIAKILSDRLGIDCKRLLGAGRAEDVGDLHGLDDWTAQVAWWPKRGVLRAFREKPEECEQQQNNAGSSFGVSFIRMHGGLWRATQTIEQWADNYFATRGAQR